MKTCGYIICVWLARRTRREKKINIQHSKFYSLGFVLLSICVLANTKYFFTLSLSRSVSTNPPSVSLRPLLDMCAKSACFVSSEQHAYYFIIRTF